MSVSEQVDQFIAENDGNARDALNVAQKTEIKYVPAFKGGRSWNGFHRDKGLIVHAVPEHQHNGFWGTKAACGTEPGRRGYGWSDTAKEINCDKCKLKLSKLA